ASFPAARSLPDLGAENLFQCDPALLPSHDYIPFSIWDGISSPSFAAVDLDGDGLLDLAIASDLDREIHTIRNVPTDPNKSGVVPLAMFNQAEKHAVKMAAPPRSLTSGDF